MDGVNVEQLEARLQEIADELEAHWVRDSELRRERSGIKRILEATGVLKPNRRAELIGEIETVMREAGGGAMKLADIYLGIEPHRPYQTVAQTCYRMMCDGVLERVSRGVYRIAQTE